jgi:hypothetical protein
VNDEEMQALITRLESDVADLGLAVRELRGEFADAVAGGNVKPAPPSAAQLDEWVAGWFTTTFARNVSSSWRWCARYSEHPEAVERLRALHIAWKEAQQTGRMLAWLRDADAQVAALSDAAGTFAACTPERHYGPPALPYELPDAEFFDEP